MLQFWGRAGNAGGGFYQRFMKLSSLRVQFHEYMKLHTSARERRGLVNEGEPCVPPGLVVGRGDPMLAHGALAWRRSAAEEGEPGSGDGVVIGESAFK